MVKELILHVGDCKTGSTALQAALARGRVDLAGRSICYPGGLNHNKLAQDVSRQKGDPDLRQRVRRQMRQLAAALDESSADYGILSAELFEFTPPRMLSAAIERHMPQYRDRLRVIAYIRPHAGRILSSFAEAAKLGQWRGSIAGFHDRAIGRGTFFYAPRLERWKGFFGDRLVVRPFVRDRLAQGDVVADFLTVLTGGSDFVLRPDAPRNEALSVEDLALLRHVLPQTSLLPDEAPLPMLGRTLGQILAAMPDPAHTRLQLPRDLAEAIVRVYRADAAATDAAWFDGAPLTAAIDSATEGTCATAQDLDQGDGFGPGDRAAAAGWAALFRRMIAEDPTRFNRAARHPDHHRGPAPDPAATALASACIIETAGALARADAGPPGQRLQAAAVGLLQRMAAADPDFVAGQLRP